MQYIEPDRMFDHAKAQAAERNYRAFPIVDIDAHHQERLGDLLPYLDPLWRRRIEGVMDRSHNLLPGDLGDPFVAGRIRRPIPTPGGSNTRLAGDPADVRIAARAMGVDLSIVFPTEMMGLGMHPQYGLEVVLARAYARWMTEEILPAEPTLRTMLYLPFNHPEESVRLVEEFGDKKGVVGFLVTSVRDQPVHHNKYMRLYHVLEERGLPLAFHTMTPWREGPFDVLNKLLSVYTLASPIYNFVHLTNLVTNGVFERFPKLRVIFMELGVAWLVFLMYRLDNEYMMRTSEVPLLKKKPSEYILESCYFSTQPLELTRSEEETEAIFNMLQGSNRFLYASNYPFWDFDLPSRIYDLSFLSTTDKHKILGGNAIELFGLHDEVAELRRNEEAEKSA